MPVYNEERALAKSIAEIHRFLSSDVFPHDWQIVVADNGSDDDTAPIGRGLEAELSGVKYLRIPERGRGHALKMAWLESEREIVSYMDVDLSTGLDAFPSLIGAVADGGYDLAIGTRHHRASDVDRSIRRDFLSRGYNMLVKGVFATHFSDAQCGFKAVRRAVARQLVPLVQSDGWFFDTELLVVAERSGYRIGEIPVVWSEDPDSRVHVAATVWEDLRGILRLRFGQPWPPSKNKRQAG